MVRAQSMHRGGEPFPPTLKLPEMARCRERLAPRTAVEAWTDVKRGPRSSVRDPQEKLERRGFFEAQS